MENFIDIMGPEGVVTDEEEHKFYSSGVYARGESCTVVLRPKDKEHLSKAARVATEAGYTVNSRAVPKSGGADTTEITSMVF